MTGRTLTRRTLARRHDERGATAIITALVLLSLIGAVALVVDLGLARDQRRMSQNGSDAAALAAGNVLVADQTDIAGAITRAKEYSTRNFGTTDADWATCTDPDRPSGFVASAVPCISFDSLTKASSVRVKMPTKNVGTIFAGVFGRDSVAVGSQAEVAFEPGGKADCGLCIIGDQDHDVQNGNIAIANGNVAFNGNAGSGPNGSVNITTTGGSISIEGDRLFPSKGVWNPAPLTQQPETDDPLAFLTMPPSTAGLVKKTNICTDGPGIYASLAPSSSPCVLSGGMYVITGGTHYSGQTDVVANGVTLYFTCKDSSGWPRPCGPGEGEDQELTGQGTLGISAPATTANNGIPGLAILADRDHAGTLSIRGNPTNGLSGTIYMKSATLDIRGNGETTTASSLIVVDDLTFSGTNATLSISYTASGNVVIPPTRLRLTK